MERARRFAAPEEDATNLRTIGSLLLIAGIALMSVGLVTAPDGLRTLSSAESTEQGMMGQGVASRPSAAPASSAKAAAANGAAYADAAIGSEPPDARALAPGAVGESDPPPPAVAVASMETGRIVTAASASPTAAPPAAPVVVPTVTATTVAPVVPTAQPPTRTPVPATPSSIPPTPSQTATPTARPVTQPPALSAPEQSLLWMHNAIRQSMGLGALQLDGALTQVARLRALDMATNSYFAHTSPTGQTAYTLLNGSGVTYGAAGENIARNNYPEAQSANVAMDGFMASEGHRKNILDTRYRRVGVGYAVGSDGMRYFAVVFSD